ncbi:MAG: hypothetical protein ACFFDP_08040 [Promethearchaeota archaeon]
MSKIEFYRELWEYLRLDGKKTIEKIKEAKAWEYRINPAEHSVRETFYHAIQAIYEDAGNWFLKDSTRFSPSKDPLVDLDTAINQMIRAIQNFQDEELDNEFTFQWGEKTTISGAIMQNLFHAVGHFSQLRNWVGLYLRSQESQ